MTDKISLVLILLLLVFHGDSTAQNDIFSGEWYIAYNQAHPHDKGTRCALRIEQKGPFYILSHVNDSCTTCIPEEGNYTGDNHGALVKGKFKITAKKNKLVYNKDGIVELISRADFANSRRIGNNAAILITEADSLQDSAKISVLKISLEYLDLAQSFDDRFVECYFNKAIAWFKLENMDSSLYFLKKTKSLDRDYDGLAFMSGFVSDYYVREAWSTYGKAGKFRQAIQELEKAVAIDSANADAWYNLGGAYYSDKQYSKAVTAFKKSLRLDPDKEKAKLGLDAAKEMIKQK